MQDIKNSAIIVQIPGLRETIQKIVFQVKAALAANKCSAAFWMGNLQNKDIYGERVLSQTSSITRSTSNDDDDLPSDDDDDEDDRIEETRSENNGRRRLGQKRNRETTSEMSDSEETLNSSRSKCF